MEADVDSESAGCKGVAKAPCVLRIDGRYERGQDEARVEGSRGTYNKTHSRGYVRWTFFPLLFVCL